MKLAIASEEKYVSGHFGHCEGFTIYDLDEDKIMKKTFVPNPGHRPGYLPVFLRDKDVDVIISGGMGETAQQLFKENGISVIVGAQGLCDEVAQMYLKGELKSTGSICREHQHEGHCNS